jgi:SNF2 family DNA or RNA helicase
MIRVEITGDHGVAYGPFSISFISQVTTLRGKKEWNADRSVKFRATKDNIALLKSVPNIEWKVIEGTDDVFEALIDRYPLLPASQIPYNPKVELRDYQLETLDKMLGKKAYAVLWEMGLGKTALLIAEAGKLYASNMIKAMVVLAPNGVHRAWANEQIPQHWDSAHNINILLWKGGMPKRAKMNEPDALNVLCINIESLIGRGSEAVTEFIEANDGQVLLVVDESHYIKSQSASRTRSAITLGAKCKFRRILTGTPIARNVEDMFSQFLFLDKSILACANLWSFRSRYCIMGGFEMRQVVGSRNIDDLYLKIADHASRLTKDEVLTLPEKQFIKVPYAMSESTAKKYKEMKRELMTFVDGQAVTSATVAASLVRLQQILSGYLPTGEDGELTEFSEERLSVLSNIIDQINGPVIVWARFRNDIERIAHRLRKEYGDDSVVTYYGGTAHGERAEAVKRFMSGEARFFVSNPAAGGVGLNLQGRCRDVVYYSNSFSSLDRQQSEDRVHRLGTLGSVTYYDIMADKSIDHHIIKNLIDKQDIASLALDKIRLMLTEEED